MYCTECTVCGTVRSTKYVVLLPHTGSFSVSHAMYSTPLVRKYSVPMLCPKPCADDFPVRESRGGYMTRFGVSHHMTMPVTWQIVFEHDHDFAILSGICLPQPAHGVFCRYTIRQLAFVSDEALRAAGLGTDGERPPRISRHHGLHPASSPRATTT